MQYSEYIDTLKEQIENKYAKELVAEEIQGHVLEQAESYEKEGMSPEKALQEAVRQMGDPVETGSKLNQIHRPVFPWKMLFLALVLTAVSMLMSVIVLGEMERETQRTQLLRGLFVVHGIEFLIIIAVLYLDYTAFMRHIKGIYAVYLVFLFLCGGIGSFGWDYTVCYLLSYSSQALYPLFFAGIMYQNRGKDVKGMIKSILWMFVPMFLFLLLEHGPFCMAVSVENGLICILMLFFAIGRGIFGKQREKQLLTLLGMIAAGSVIFFGMLFPTREYWKARMMAILNPALGEAGYQNLAVRENFSGVKLFGGTSLLPVATQEMNYDIYLLNDIFAYFGVVAGVTVLAVFILFLCKAFKEAVYQRNRMGFLLGIACSSGLLMRVIAYVAINFGFAFWYTTAVPFFSGNLMDAIVNGIYVGLLFSILRNKMVLGETQVARKEEKMRLPAA